MPKLTLAICKYSDSSYYEIVLRCSYIDVTNVKDYTRKIHRGLSEFY